MELQMWDVVEATFKPVRTDDLKPEALACIGQRGYFQVLGFIDEKTRSDGAYAGQAELWPYRRGNGDQLKMGWAPECDFEIHRLLPFEEAMALS